MALSLYMEKAAIKCNLFVELCKFLELCLRIFLVIIWDAFFPAYSSLPCLVWYYCLGHSKLPICHLTAQYITKYNTLHTLNSLHLQHTSLVIQYTLYAAHPPSQTLTCSWLWYKNWQLTVAHLWHRIKEDKYGTIYSDPNSSFLVHFTKFKYMTESPGFRLTLILMLVQQDFTVS